MPSIFPGTTSLRGLSGDGRLLFATRTLRLFAYGFLSIVLVLYLTQLGFSESRIGLLLTLTLAGDTAVSLWLTTRADRLGRRRMLLAGAVLMILAGGVFAVTRNFLLLLVAATIGVISPSGNEVGPFLSIEQAALAHVVEDRRRTPVFAWYTLAGAVATALGALCGGVLTAGLQRGGFSVLASYRAAVLGYGLLGAGLLVLFLRLSPAVEVAPPGAGVPPADSPAPAGASHPAAPSFLGLTHSKGVVLRLSGLFALDAFGGGFVIQSFAAYWFHKRFHTNEAMLGSLFFGANVLAGLSALAAASLARRFGLINTMVFTHLPSNILLIMVPLMPNLPLAAAALLLRFSISQMDVPTRQSYTMAVVRPEERSAAGGVTNVVRSTGAALAPTFAGALLASPPLMNVPFYLSGGLKIVYDVLLYRSFKKIKPPEEK